ncbi:MAG TPA: helix-turn-helix transcriptional regulator [Rubrobacter sp.]
MREIDKRYAPEDERPGIGHFLRRARRKRGVSLEDAERATMIRKDYLERLENDDHDAMPEPIYVQGLVRAYANYLDLDGDRLASQVAFWQERRRRTRRGPLWGL